MAGFFEKLTKAVGDITKKVEESGIADDLKDLVSGDEDAASSAAASAEGSAASAGSDEEPSDWSSAVARAGFDPMDLLTPAEVDAVLGLGLDHSYQQMDDEWFGTTWTSKRGGGPYVEVRFTHGYTDGSPVDLPGIWTFVTDEVGARPLAGITGAEAVIDDLDTVYVRAPRSVFYVVSGGLPEGRSVQEVHVALATAVVAALS